jgi:diketogulonate reductase-like aldo/keto reductase
LSNLTIDSTIMLNNRVRMPLIGFGCAEITPWTSEQERIIRTAIDAGYRLLDTAIAYETEHGVGNAWRSSGIDREKFFISTKVPSGAIRSGRKEIVRSFEQSLRNLRTDYVDLYLIHWPPQGKIQEAWEILEYLYYSGRTRAIGISNLNRRHWLEVMASCEVMPHVQQDEFHPYRMNEYNRIFCEQHNIHFEAFLPVARGLLRENPILKQLAEKYNKNTFQIILRWDLQHGVTAIPRSSNPKHIADNIDLYDFELTEEEVAMIDSINKEGQMNRDIDNFNF